MACRWHYGQKFRSVADAEFGIAAAAIGEDGRDVDTELAGDRPPVGAGEDRGEHLSLSLAQPGFVQATKPHGDAIGAGQRRCLPRRGRQLTMLVDEPGFLEKAAAETHDAMDAWTARKARLNAKA